MPPQVLPNQPGSIQPEFETETCKSCGEDYDDPNVMENGICENCINAGVAERCEDCGNYFIGGDDGSRYCDRCVMDSGTFDNQNRWQKIL